MLPYTYLLFHELFKILLKNVLIMGVVELTCVKLTVFFFQSNNKVFVYIETDLLNKYK